MDENEKDEGYVMKTLGQAADCAALWGFCLIAMWVWDFVQNIG